MKKKFSTAWKSSSKRRKQRKFLAHAPIHIKRKQLSANLSTDLRKKYEVRNLPLVKSDKVKILRGKYKNKEGKVIRVVPKLLKIYIEGIQSTKQDGSKVDVPLRPSNLQIIELNLNDKKRLKKIAKPKKEEKSQVKEEKK